MSEKLICNICKIEMILIKTESFSPNTSYGSSSGSSGEVITTTFDGSLLKERGKKIFQCPKCLKEIDILEGLY